MSELPRLLSDVEFKSAVSNLPLISIDLLIRDGEGRYLLGLRKNEPAKGSWFVPGGRIRKSEGLRDAFNRITLMELDKSFDFEQAKLVGIFEHIYDESSHGSDGGTHYLSMGFELELGAKLENMPIIQHDRYRWAKREEILEDNTIHEYTKDFFRENLDVHYRVD